jgi:hypothetical protein
MYFKIFLFTWFFTNFEPFQVFLEKLFITINDKINQYNNLKIINNHLYNILSCHKCLSFWVCIISTGDFLSSILLSFIANLLKK